MNSREQQIEWLLRNRSGQLVDLHELVGPGEFTYTPDHEGTLHDTGDLDPRTMMTFEEFSSWAYNHPDIIVWSEEHKAFFRVWCEGVERASYDARFKEPHRAAEFPRYFRQVERSVSNWMEEVVRWHLSRALNRGSNG